MAPEGHVGAVKGSCNINIQIHHKLSLYSGVFPQVNQRLSLYTPFSQICPPVDGHDVTQRGSTVHFVPAYFSVCLR